MTNIYYEVKRIEILKNKKYFNPNKKIKKKNVKT